MTKIIHHQHQPYTTMDVEVTSVEPIVANEWTYGRKKWLADNGYLTVKGVVIKGFERSRIGQYSSDKDLTGRTVTFEMSQKDFEAGRYITVAG